MLSVSPDFSPNCVQRYELFLYLVALKRKSGDFFANCMFFSIILSIFGALRFRRDAAANGYQAQPARLRGGLHHRDTTRRRNVPPELPTHTHRQRLQRTALCLGRGQRTALGAGGPRRRLKIEVCE